MSSGSLARLRPIKDYLKSKFIAVSDHWITNQLNTNNSITSEMVYQKWLDSDLRKISSTNECAALPTDCNQIKVDEQTDKPIKTTLNGKFALQINSIEDISRPKVLSAADALENELNSGSDDNSENETENQTKLFKKRKTAPKKKEVTKRGARLLSMMLTDGVTECKAIEYQPIPCLTVNTAIGSKVLISGPLEIHTGIMFLSTCNVKLLGGSVPLSESNTVNDHGSSANSGNSANDRTSTPLRTLFEQTSNNMMTPIITLD